MIKTFARILFFAVACCSVAFTGVFSNRYVVCYGDDGHHNNSSYVRLKASLMTGYAKPTTTS